jgi:uncharacterized protein (DUF433 family)
MSSAPVQHIAIDSKGIARVAGSRSRVSQIVVDYQTMSPQEIVETYSHLTLADVYAALSYYHDHQAEIDAEIREANQLYEAGLERQRNDSDFQAFVQELKRRAGRS